MSHKFFALHQAVKGHKSARDVRIVNAVAELRYDIEQMPQYAAVVFHRLRRGDALTCNAITQHHQRFKAVQCTGDTFAEGAARQRFAKQEVQCRKVFIHQSPAGLAFRPVQFTLRAEPDI